MNAISSTSSLPIKQIRDVNLSWVRDNLGSLDSLRDSIEEHGLKLPILMTTGMLVADGARRLVACEQLGWKRIDVLVTSDWAVVTDYYAQVRSLAREGWPTEPMSWSDLADLLSGPMKDLYSERYRQERKQIADQNARTRRSGTKVVYEHRKDLYLNACAEVLAFRSKNDLRTIRELYAKLRRMASPATKGEDPARVAFRHTWAKTLTEQLRECEENGGDRLYALMARIRMADRGEDPSTVGDPSLTERKASVVAVAPTGREVDATFIANVSQMLAQLGDTARYYTHVRPTVRMSDAAHAATEMRLAVRYINGLIKVIAAYGTNPNLEERQNA